MNWFIKSVIACNLFDLGILIYRITMGVDIFMPKLYVLLVILLFIYSLTIYKIINKTNLLKRNLFISIILLFPSIIYLFIHVIIFIAHILDALISLG
jgi:hypothetical protein